MESRDAMDVAVVLQRPLNGTEYNVRDMWTCIEETDPGECLEGIVTIRDQVCGVAGAVTP